MADILVTGGAGFIGSNFVRYWREKHNQGVVVLDALTYAGNAASIADVEGATLVEGDICDTDLVQKLLRDNDIRTIVHFAAESHVDRSITGPDAFVQTNVIGTHSLLRAAKAEWLDRGGDAPHRFHHVSTDEVYGSLGPDDPAFSETTAYAPNSPYSASKAGSDHLVRAYHHTFGMDVVTTNCSNNYGPFQFPEKLIPLFLINALEGRNLPVFGDGMNVRDWLFVTDHCRGIELALEKGRPGEVYNIGGGEELPNLTVIETICDVVDQAFANDPAMAERYPDAPAARGESTCSLRTFVEDRKGHDRRYAIDERKARTKLGYVPTVNFKGGIERTIGWYLENEEWWRPLLESRS